MAMLLRVGLGLGAATLFGAAGGPGGALIGWKLAGFVASGGNPIYLVPGGTLVADGASFLADAADLADLDPGESNASSKKTPSWWR